jgi:integrase/recombinase XerD
VHTNATTDGDLLAVWLKSHADGSPHTRRAYERIGRRFIEALAATGSGLRRATVEDVQNALEAMRSKVDGTTGSAASLNTYVAAVKALLGFAHKVGFTRFNAAPLIKLRKAPRKIAQRLLSQVELHLLLRAAGSKRDRLMLEVAYFGALRVSELASLTWGQVIPRETGEAQLDIVGKGDKPRNILVPAEVAAALGELRGEASGQGGCLRSRSGASTTSSRRRRNAPGSISRSPRISCATPMRATPSMRVRPSRSFPKPWGMPT